MVGLESPQQHSHDEEKQESHEQTVNDELSQSTSGEAYSIKQSPLKEEKAIGFIGALKIPGVIEFSLCLFFSKLVSYAFLFWLPKYIHSANGVDAEHAGE